MTTPTATQVYISTSWATFKGAIQPLIGSEYFQGHYRWMCCNADCRNNGTDAARDNISVFTIQGQGGFSVCPTCALRLQDGQR